MDLYEILENDDDTILKWYSDIKNSWKITRKIKLVNY